MRITKALLEEFNSILESKVKSLEVELVHQKEIIKLYEIFNKLPLATMTVALERINDAVAHVISDLKKKS